MRLHSSRSFVSAFIVLIFIPATLGIPLTQVVFGLPRLRPLSILPSMMDVIGFACCRIRCPYNCSFCFLTNLRKLTSSFTRALLRTHAFVRFSTQLIRSIRRQHQFSKASMRFSSAFFRVCNPINFSYPGYPKYPTCRN